MTFTWYLLLSSRLTAKNMCYSTFITYAIYSWYIYIYTLDILYGKPVPVLSGIDCLGNAGRSMRVVVGVGARVSRLVVREHDVVERYRYWLERVHVPVFVLERGHRYVVVLVVLRLLRWGC